MTVVVSGGLNELVLVGIATVVSGTAAVSDGA